MTRKNIDLNKISWFHGASRGKNHAVLFIDSIGIISMTEKYPEKNYGFPYNGKYYMQGHGSRSIGQEDHDAMTEILNRRLKQEPDFFYNFGARMEKLAREIRLWADKVKGTDWRGLTNLELAKVIYEHCLRTAKIWSIPLVYAYYFYFNDKIVERFIEKARQRLGVTFDKIMPAILAQEKMSEIAQERKELLKLAVQKLQGASDAERKIENHWKKFAHLNNYYYWGQGYTLEDMRARLQEEIKRGIQDLRKELDGFKPKKLDLKFFTGTERIAIKSMKKSAYALQFADESLAYAIHNIRGVYNEAAIRLNISYNQLVSMLLSEIMESLERGKLVITKEKLDQRYEEHALFIIKGKSIIISGEEFQRYIKGRIKKVDTSINEFKGTVAFKGGLIKGRVHLISRAEEISSFKSGEILVTPMTNPSFVQAMRLAAAIITDDGGLLCHAAIVARELKKPCVIGTKIATKVLHDGDLVEVDADKGVVKILKKAAKK